MTLNIAVVDDTRLDCERLQQRIHRWFTDNNNTSRTITCFHDGRTILKTFEPGKYHIVFMDIIMQDFSGIDTARQLRTLDDRLLIVFTTTSRDFALDAFPVHPFDYLVKPCEPSRLAGVLTDALRLLDTPDPAVNVRVSRSICRIPYRSISAVLSRNHTVEVVMTDGNCLLCSMTFREFEAALLEDSRFLLCNRGVIINMDCVSSLSRNRDMFTMKDGSCYAIRVRGNAKIIADFTQYQISRVRGTAGR